MYIIQNTWIQEGNPATISKTCSLVFCVNISNVNRKIKQEIKQKFGATVHSTRNFALGSINKIDLMKENIILYYLKS